MDNKKLLILLSIYCRHQLLFLSIKLLLPFPSLSLCIDVQNNLAIKRMFEMLIASKAPSLTSMLSQWYKKYYFITPIDFSTRNSCTNTFTKNIMSLQRQFQSLLRMYKLHWYSTFNWHYVTLGMPTLWNISYQTWFQSRPDQFSSMYPWQRHGFMWFWLML